MALIIYLIGYVACYFIGKYLVMRAFKFYKWNWEDVMFSLFTSLFSWVGIIIHLILFLIHVDKPFLGKKPPKWL